MEANDMAKMREACQKMRDLLMLRGDGMARCTLTWDEFNESQKMLRNALSAPARNCDVGTAREIDARWNAYCEERIKRENCMSNKNCKGCSWRWAQMPYNEEGVKVE